MAPDRRQGYAGIDRMHALSYLCAMQLSDAQRQAVEYLDTPQIILAGAGSGKTRVIVAKAQYLIEQKRYLPESLLVITYSRKTQAELEERMAELGDSAPEIKTFHSLGLDIINEFLHLLGFAGEAVKADDYRLHLYLMRAIAELVDSRLLRTNNPASVYGDLESFISRAKDELATPSEIISRAQNELHGLPDETADEDDDTRVARERWTAVYEAGRIYQSYENLKSSDSGPGATWIDYGDMIVLSHMLLSTEKIVGATLRQRIKYILVDEFQDANYAQVEMLYHLTGNKTGITVVGDDDQAIYRFRGASFGSFKLFKSLFKNARDHKLEENYRSTRNIVNAAQSSIEAEPAARFNPDKRMFASGPEGNKVKIRICPDHETEAESLADEIEELLNNELFRRPKSIAALFRTRKHKDLLEKALIHRGIDYAYDKKAGESSSPEARLLLAIYEFTIDRRRNDHLAYIINHFTARLAPADEREIMYQISRTDSDPLETLSAAAEPLSSDLVNLVELLRYFRNVKSEKNPPGLLEAIVSKTGMLSTLIRDGMIIDDGAVREVAGILRSAEALVNGDPAHSHSDFINYMNWREDFREGESDDIRTPVVLQTIHGAKGLEYPVVFVMGLSNQRFPPKRRSLALEFPQELYKDELPEGDYRIQEERRLFYVAMTRAREKLYLYGIEKKGTKRSRFLQELASAPFFEETCQEETVESKEMPAIRIIGPPLARDNSKSIIIPGSGEIASNLADGLFKLWRIHSSRAESPDDLAGIKEDFKRQTGEAVSSLKAAIDKEEYQPLRPTERYKAGRISYSDLEAFDTCPLQFYYGKALNMPSPSNPYMLFGSTIHSALEAAAVRMMAGETVAYDDLVRDYESLWKKAPLDNPDLKERMRQNGYELLRYFLKAQSELKGKPIELERKFAVALGDIELTGRIDRVDKTPDGLEIIDYKTGKMDAKKLKGDLQLPIYALACKKLYGEYPVRLLYMFLKEQDIYLETFDSRDIEKIKSDILGKIDRINASDFTATPGYHCGNCPYSNICPAAER